MFSRWAYEALIVEQFKHNKYQQNFFEIEKEKSEAVYISSYLITELNTRLKKCEEGMKEEQYKELVEKYFNILRTEISQLKELPELANLKYEHLNSLNSKDFTEEIATDTYQFFKDVKTIFNARSNDINELKDNKIRELEKKYGKQQLIDLKKKYYNEKLAEFVLNKTQINQYYETNNMLIRKKDPIYMEPYSHYGRAQFYAPVKIIGNYHFDTFWFNVAFLWLSIFFLYLTLYFDVLKKVLKFSGRINLKKLKIKK